jgi:hypothetical protein
LSGFDPTTVEGEKLMALRASLSAVASAGAVLDASKLGYFLRTSKRRLLQGLKFEILGETRGVARWAVVPGA